MMANDKPNVLIVDDQPRNLDVLEVMLGGTDCTLVRATSADEALLCLVRHEFAALVLDIKMPGMDGIELATLIRQRKRSQDVPIVFLTAYSVDEDEVLRGYGVGAVDYLSKPVNGAILRSKIAVFVDAFRKTRALAELNVALQREVAEREKAQEALQLANQELDRRVQERTAALTRAHQVLQEKNVDLERATGAKSDFISSMSHELRSPLNAILGFAQLLEIDPTAITPSQKASIDQILRAGWYLLELINTILDLAQIESGKLSLSPEPVLLSDVMDECEAIIEPRRQNRGISMTFPRFDLPCFVDADRTRLKQVVINLLSNAVKYNRVGGTVAVECTTCTPARVRISVRDTGAGLSPEKLAQLFQSFNRLGQEAGAEEGTGIGLVVTKRLVELMGGAIGVESTVGVGSVFWIELVATGAPHVDGDRPAPTVAAQAQMLTGARLRTLLYVEDNPANLALVEQLLEHCAEIRLMSARNATLGIQIARDAQPDVILMDINLPGLTGLDAMTILRNDPLTAHIPIVALSANAMPRDIKKGMDAGFFRYVTKPINFIEFMDTLRVALEFAETRGSAMVPASGA